MPENISKYSTLLVISDTGLFYKNGSTFAFGPVVKELRELNCFEKIEWIGFNRKDQIDNKSYIKIQDTRISTIGLKMTGGKSLVSKFVILFNYPLYTLIIFKAILKVQYIHVRSPSNPAVIAMFLSYFFPKKKFWFKYAGDWQGKASFFYMFQRLCLKKLNKNSKVTVNGKWENQPKNIIAFENPCLDTYDRARGKSTIAIKNIKQKINFCFVGGLNENKGCLMLLLALQKMVLPLNFGSLHIVGDGHLKAELQQLAAMLDISIVFHGALAKDKVIEVYELCHFMILPSKSEGFPKVIGEAMNYGCVPIVSNVSCIGQYVKDLKNGVLIEPLSVEEIINSINKSFGFSENDFKEIIQYNYNLAGRFTYEYYKERLISDIFN